MALSGEPLGSTMGALDAGTGELIVSTSPTKISADFIGLLRRLDWRYGPKPGGTRLPIVLVLDNGPVHTSKVSRAAPAERPWITVEWLPRYASELNDIENVWEYLRSNKLSNSVFDTYDTIVDRCCTTWNWLTETLDRIRTIASAPWAKTVKA